ncbi:MAG TPA: glutathione S-transferase N-terminal domain-containing protein [Candidatus Sulfotelmatobacter sp.]|jgi:glutathione S-transferase|nr:glutathione S-transferase N-terminal domain-containing protein [Candidatus Sulfotelmatobacter sp.]
MKLRYSPTSPYVRKVTILALETGLDDRIERLKTNAWDPATDLPADNPLGKVPALILDDGQQVYDSPVICEVLDSLHDGAKFFPPAGPARWTAIRRQALADGILDAALQVVIESLRRPVEYRWSGWIDRQKAAIARGLNQLEQEAADLGKQFTIGEVAIAAALGYLDFRQIADDWRRTHPRLAAWYAEAEKRPSVAATVPME